MERWTIQQVMAERKICRATVYNLIKRDVLRKYKDAHGRGRGGRRVYFNAEQVRLLDPDYNQQQIQALLDAGKLPPMPEDLERQQRESALGQTAPSSIKADGKRH